MRSHPCLPYLFSFCLIGRCSGLLPWSELWTLLCGGATRGWRWSRLLRAVGFYSWVRRSWVEFYVQPSLGQFGFWPYSVRYIASAWCNDDMYDDDAVLWDSGVVCPAYLSIYVFLSCRVYAFIPVVENPAATRVRVSWAGGTWCASNSDRTRKRLVRVSTTSGALQLGIRAGLTVGPFTGRSWV